MHTPSCVSLLYTERFLPKGRSSGIEISMQPEDRESRAETDKCLLHPTALASHFAAEFAKEPAGLGMGPAETCLLY